MKSSVPIINPEFISITAPLLFSILNLFFELSCIIFDSELLKAYNEFISKENLSVKFNLYIKYFL